MFGSCWQQWSTVAPTAAASGLTVLCIEYRLAPEHPFPAALNDVVSVYKELLQQGYAAHNLVILGDSAGKHPHHVTDCGDKLTTVLPVS